MKKAAIFSLAIIFILLLYLFFTLLFGVFFRRVSDSRIIDTWTPVPTFTSTPTVTGPAIAEGAAETSTPVPIPTFTPAPTSSPTATALPPELPTSTPSPSPTPQPPHHGYTTVVNIRSGPGTNYPVIGSLSPGQPLLITGRNESGTWWQVQPVDSPVGWVAASVVEARGGEQAPIVAGPSLPEPTPIPVPPAPTQPRYQFEPTGWYGDVNYGLTRFLGSITDVNGNPVNGVFVEAQCGSYRVISNPSGPVGWGPFNESHTWDPGFYDITIDNKPVPCNWQLTVVATEDRETVTARLSETVEVEVTTEQSIIVANWRKNW